jgi:predicted transcriptional regulator
MKRATSLRLQEDIVKRVSARAKAHRRTLTNQIEEYIRIAMEVEENPDLPYSFIKETIEAREEIKAGLGIPYKFGVIK